MTPIVARMKLIGYVQRPSKGITHSTAAISPMMPSTMLLSAAPAPGMEGGLAMVNGLMTVALTIGFAIIVC